jgi:hypothetical protein
MEPTKNEARLIAASNILIAVVVTVDLFVITGWEGVNLYILTVVNLIILVIGFITFRIKKRIRQQKLATSSPPSPPSSSPPTEPQEPQSAQQVS